MVPMTTSSDLSAPGSGGVSAPPTAAPAGRVAAAPAGTRSGSSTRRAVLLHLVVFAGFVLLGVGLWWNVWITGHPTTTITCQCGDPSQGLWFLTWTPWAVVHGHSPFLTNAIFAGQGGANMMINTSWMVPSLVFAPVTWLFGPIATFNVVGTLAPAVSAWCFFVAARRVTTLVPAQILGGLLFGFSPFVVQNDPFGHLNFTLLYFPPLAFVLVHELLVTRRRSPVVVGAWSAALVVAEFFTSTELLAMTVVVMAIALAGAAAMAPGQAWALRRRVGTAAAVAGGIVVVALAYPVWLIEAGPRHITGLPWPDSPDLGTTPGAVINSGVGAHASSFFDVVGGYFGGVGPNSGPLHLPSLDYLGPALVVFLVVSVITWHRSRLVWTIVIGTVAAWLFSFGTTLGTEGRARSAVSHPWWAPWRLFAHVPLVSDILPIRFGVMVTFGAALLLAISLDRWCALGSLALDRAARPSGAPAGGRRHDRRVAAVITTVVGAALLVPVAHAESVPFKVESSAPPAWFTAAAPRLAPGTVVLVEPFQGQQAEGWQAQSGLHFALAGGFAVVPGPDGRSEFVVPPTGAVATLGRLSADPDESPVEGLVATDGQIAQVQAALVRWHVGITVVTEVGDRPAYTVGFFAAVYGRPPSLQHGAWVWSGPPGTTGTGAAGRLASCTGPGGPVAPVAVADCVLGTGASGDGPAGPRDPTPVGHNGPDE
jgi:hypothetical protein